MLLLFSRISTGEIKSVLQSSRGARDLAEALLESLKLNVEALNLALQHRVELSLGEITHLLLRQNGRTRQQPHVGTAARI